MRRLLLTSLLLATALLGWLVWPVAAGDGAAPLLRHEDPRTVALGRAVYDAQCAACHGADLAGQPDWRQRGPDGLLPAPPHDASGHTWHHPSEMLIALTKAGPAAMVGGGYESAMPGFGEVLSDAEIAAALAYIKSTWPPEIVAAHDEIDARHAAGRP
ncbi:c-type cytochrome [Jannaschia ovalis]|uniref:Cytochrome c n=1 Tax=Jannaschia ovalis TaxID=3038773 RepID=A0ABY8LGE9_9RHOB|nr:cytochrome c [Jannaschia sp. GRR-S6-38]WGH79229.1 cytochrome c [Jannaschia sp. GRR-S6-38]